MVTSCTGVGQLTGSAVAISERFAADLSGSRWTPCGARDAHRGAGDCAMRALRFARVAQRRLCTYIEPELRPRKGERVDSVTDLILKERAAHMERIANAWCTDKAVVARIKKDKLGSKKGSHAAKRSMQRQESAKARQDHKAVFIGRGGAGGVKRGVQGGEKKLTDWHGINREGLREVALLGHSNCGKSALLNVLAAEKVSEGPAEVHARAGWTATLSFYRIEPPDAALFDPAYAGVAAMEDEERRRRPRLVLVDTPGYGFAVGEKAQEQHHSDLLADYTSRSPHLRVAVMLIDSTRGLCAADRRVLRALGRSGVSVLPVLTKVDLLRPDELAASHAIVVEQLAATVAAAEGVRPTAFVDLSRPLPMISSLFFAGIRSFWRDVAYRLARVEERRANAEPIDVADDGAEAEAAAEAEEEPEEEPRGLSREEESARWRERVKAYVSKSYG